MTRIGYAAGAFDLFHVGHLNILKHAKSQCDFLIAGVVSDEMLERNKGITPVVPLAERLEIVSHISYVDEARAETLPDKLDTWRDVGFDVFFKGDDWRGTPKGAWRPSSRPSAWRSCTSRTRCTPPARGCGARSTS
jgi:glycerol-3-phosphate cytidylyltransferase